jgi:predicted acetyltransferase
MDLEIQPASDADYGVVCNLARFYIYDIAEQAGWHFPPDGLFDSEDRFANYWGRPGAKHRWPSTWRGFPFLIRIGGHPAGFALVKRISEAPPRFDMGEFFVGRQHRRRGVGQHVAVELFDRFVGLWEVREIPANKPAQTFWRHVIAGYSGGAFTEARESFEAYDGREFIVQRFHSVADARITGAARMEI